MIILQAATLALISLGATILWVISGPLTALLAAAACLLVVFQVSYRSSKQAEFWQEKLTLEASELQAKKFTGATRVKEPAAQKELRRLHKMAQMDKRTEKLREWDQMHGRRPAA